MPDVIHLTLFVIVLAPFCLASFLTAKAVEN